MAESGSLSSTDEDSYYNILKLNFAENVDSVQHNDKNLSLKPNRNWQVSLLMRD